MVGYIVGYAVSGSGMLSDQYVLTGDQSRIDVVLEAQVFQKVSGRFLVVYLTQEVQGVYLDATGSLAALYDAAEECVFSTTAVRGLTDQSASFTNYVKEHQLKWLFSGKTQFKGIHRIIPNHYLDLKKWILDRHYPKPGQFQRHISLSERIQIIADEIRRVATALSTKGLYMSLTAGADCRLVMASLRPLVGQITTSRKLFSVLASSLDSDALPPTEFHRPGSHNLFVDNSLDTPSTVIRTYT